VHKPAQIFDLKLMIPFTQEVSSFLAERYNKTIKLFIVSVNAVKGLDINEF